jgi:hypothetical protein
MLATLATRHQLVAEPGPSQAHDPGRDDYRCNHFRAPRSFLSPQLEGPHPLDQTDQGCVRKQGGAGGRSSS